MLQRALLLLPLLLLPPAAAAAAELLGMMMMMWEGGVRFECGGDVWWEVNDVAVGERRGFSRAGTEKGFGCVWVGAWELNDVVDMWPLASAAFRVQVPKKALDELSQGW